MRSSIRAKLLVMLAIVIAAFAVLMAVSVGLGRRIQAQLAAIERQYIPRMELAPKLARDFTGLVRGIQDATAANDADALAATLRLKDKISADLDAATKIIGAENVMAVRAEMEVYYTAARTVAERLIAGEGGENVGASIADMQERQKRTLALIERVADVDHSQLGRAFIRAADAQGLAVRIQVAVSVLCMTLLALLSAWIGRGVIGALVTLRQGFEHFGTNDFAWRIPALGEADVDHVAQRANQMADSLQRLNEERERRDWVQNGFVTLGQRLRGDLEPKDAAAHALGHLVQYVGAPAGALYSVDTPGILRLLAQEAVEPPAVLRLGEGVTGAAATQSELRVIDDLPEGFLRVRSSLGEASAKCLVLLPLLHADRVSGVLELAFFTPAPARVRELLLASRESIAIALEVARVRKQTKELLEESQQQAQRLLSQEEELRASNEELAAQGRELKLGNDELEDARVRLEQKAKELSAISSYKSQFLTNMSHELRTPLNSMLLLSHQLSENLEGNLTAKQVEHCRTVHGAGKDLLALINQVLDLAKIESGKQEIFSAAIDVGEMIGRLRRVFEPLAKDKALQFRVELDPALPKTIESDHQRIEQIVTNLLGNAMKFTTRGQVTLRVRKPNEHDRFTRADLDLGNCIALEVEDTGVGIAPEHQARIFESFEQVDGRMDRRFGGSGLGLSIVKELATLLGGEVQLRSRPAAGSTFTCFVRCALESTPVAATVHTPNDDTATDPGSEHILVVEDDGVFARAFEEVIHAQGFSYLHAKNAEAAVRLAKERRPIGIVLDVKLPDRDGFWVMAQLKEDPKTRDIPVHFVSAVDANARGMSLGAIGYVTKPTTRMDLTRVVSAIVAKHDEQRDAQILLVEPNEAASAPLIQLLAGERWKAHCVGSAGAALAALRETSFVCMIVDLSLPDMEGLEFLRTVEAQTGDRMPSVVVYTGRPLQKTETKQIEAYAEAIVLKEGRSIERLLDEVRLFVRRLRHTSEPAPSTPALLPIDLRGRTLLVVDDDMRTVYALSALLQAKGAEVVVADTGVAALSVLAERPNIDLVLMDIMMPEMDGYEATTRIRADPRFAHLPIITLTAKAMLDDEARCLEAGATAYLSKPVDAERLSALLARYLGGPHAT